MTRTAQLGLPLVMPAQAQKHVTVNEALAILDAVTQLRLVAVAEQVPPLSPRHGETYAVPAGAEGEWSGQVGSLATYSNGSWIYIQPHVGWQAWVEAEGRRRVFDGATWVPDAVAIAPRGGAARVVVDEFDHLVEPGPTNVTAFLIPKNAMVFGISGRVIESMDGGGLPSWRLGVSGSDNRYGAGLGTGLNAYALGLTSSPLTYYEPTPLLLTAEDGAFTSGKVRLAIAYLELTIPRVI